VRQYIRGYADAVVEQIPGELATTTVELQAVRDLINGSDDLRGALVDPGVPAAARRAVINDLFVGRVGAPTVRLLAVCVESDRASEFLEDLAWLVLRIDAGARHLEALDDIVLGHKAAEERVDGYASGVLEQVDRGRALTEVEDELFRFMRIVDGTPQLRDALSSRDVSAGARRHVVTDLLQTRATPTTLSLAAYATQVGRPRDYEALLAFLVERVAAESDRRVAEVRAAVELDDDQRRQLETALSGVAGRAVEVRVTIDPAVLGGFVATIGDTVVDGSVRHRLDILKERLVMPEARIGTGDPTNE
jgi:F-type H+-transporting ATPase subunit delta